MKSHFLNFWVLKQTFKSLVKRIALKVKVLLIIRARFMRENRFYFEFLKKWSSIDGTRTELGKDVAFIQYTESEKEKM